jgi:perosamine synthetase
MVKKYSLIVPLSKPTFDEEMENAALYALKNEHFVLGEDVYKFEEEFARFCGSKHAISTSSGTHALQLSLLALGIGRRNNVMTTTFSFVATSNAILHVNANPVLVDIDILTYNIDPLQILKRKKEGTRAIIPVHLYGYPADMEPIMHSAASDNFKVVEDACQAHGAIYHGSKVGTIGDVGCFSFYPSKNMTVGGDGGMVVTNDEEIAARTAKLRDCGRVTKYEHDIVGYTSRLNTVNAAIGRVQLKRLETWNRQRMNAALLYHKLLSDLDEVVLPPSGDRHVKPVHHLFVIRVEKRDDLKKWLEDNGIQCGIHYPLPIHLQPVYKRMFKFREGDYPASELAARTCLSLPMYPSLKSDEIKYVSERVHEFFNRSRTED